MDAYRDIININIDLPENSLGSEEDFLRKVNMFDFLSMIGHKLPNNNGYSVIDVANHINKFGIKTTLKISDNSQYSQYYNEKTGSFTTSSIERIIKECHACHENFGEGFTYTTSKEETYLCTISPIINNGNISGSYLNSVRFIKQLTGWGLKASKDFVDSVSTDKKFQSIHIYLTKEEISEMLSESKFYGSLSFDGLSVLRHLKISEILD